MLCDRVHIHAVNQHLVLSSATNTELGCHIGFGEYQLFYRFTDDVTTSTSKSGANGSSIYYLGRFYDNVHVRRKGVTSLSWPKPKLKFKLAAPVSSWPT